MGCQKKIAEQICKEKKADYGLALKGNHPDLHNKVASLFRLAEKQLQIQTDIFSSHDKGDPCAVRISQGAISSKIKMRSPYADCGSVLPSCRKNSTENP